MMKKSLRNGVMIFLIVSLVLSGLYYFVPYVRYQLVPLIVGGRDKSEILIVENA